MSIYNIEFRTPAISFETITVSTAAIGFTASKLKVVTETAGARSGGQDLSFVDVQRADKALVTIVTNPIRMRLDGTAPTSTVGHLLAAGDSVLIYGTGNLANALFIKDTAAAGDAVVSVTYFRNS